MGQIGYEFIGNQGIGKDAMQPHSTWAMPDILDALLGAVGSILVIYDGQKFIAAIDVAEQLVRFGFRHAYPLVKASAEKDVRNMGKIAARFWSGKVDAEGLEKARIYYGNKYGRQFESAEYAAAWRLMDAKPCTVANAAMLAGLHLNKADLATSLKKHAIRVLTADA